MPAFGRYSRSLYWMFGDVKRPKTVQAVCLLHRSTCLLSYPRALSWQHNVDILLITGVGVLVIIILVKTVGSFMRKRRPNVGKGVRRD